LSASRLVNILTQKPQKDCAAISSASPVDTRMAEWIAAQMNTGFALKHEAICCKNGNFSDSSLTVEGPCLKMNVSVSSP
jgi:hypothetical protein